MIANLIFFSKLSTEKSIEECFSNTSLVWKFNGVKYLNDNYSLEKDSLISYDSERKRKKFSIDFCGEIKDSYFMFLNNDFVSVENLKDEPFLHVIRNESKMKYSFQLHNKGTIIGKKEISYKPNDICFSIIYGRGYFGLFNKPHIEGKEPLILVEMSMRRSHNFYYLSQLPSNVSRLCIGDFLGENRIDINLDTQWDSQMKDFL